MESRSRVVTTNSNIFCVAKLDWQFIGNIRLRGVTPSFRVPCNQQKSPLSPSLSITPSPILAALRWMQVCSIVGTSDTPTGGVTIPFHWLLSMRPTDTVPWTDATAARGRICITFVLLAVASSGPLTIFEFYSLNPQLLPFPFDSMIFPKIHREFTLFSLNVFFFFSRI